MTRMTSTLPDRLMAKIEQIRGGCWEWTGAIDKTTGYGRIQVKPGVTGYSHRVSYEQFVGPIPQGLNIDHLCRNKRCANPEHLEAVTPRVNTLRGVGGPAAKARQTHCVHGHPLSGDNLLRGSKGQRKCRTCNTENARRWQRAQRHRTAEPLEASA